MTTTPTSATQNVQRKQRGGRLQPRGEAASASRPVLELDVKILSQPARQVFDRTFRYAAINLYAIDRIATIVLGPDVYREAAATVNGWFDEYKQKLAEERTRVDTIREQMGLPKDQVTTYSNPQTYKAEISTPLAVKYLKLIEALDEFARLVDTLWLHGAFDDTHKVEVRIYSWKQRLIKISGHIRQLAQELRRRIKDKGIVVPKEVSHLVASDAPRHDEEAGPEETEPMAVADEGASPAAAEAPKTNQRQRAKANPETIKPAKVATG